MEKMNPKKYTKKDITYDLKIALKKAKEDKLFAKFISKFDINDSEMIKYTSRMEDACLECKNCATCKSLAECKNKVEGFVYTPNLEKGKISFSYVPCKYTEKINNQNKHKINILSFDIPKDLMNASMKDIDTSGKGREEVIKYVVDYAKNYKDKEKGLYLSGNFGSGKTYLISALFNELAKKNEKVAIVYWPEFLRRLKASFNDGFKSDFNRIKKVKFLLIDDIGAENVTAWGRDEILGSILQYRMQEKLPTFFTSNFTIEELENHFNGVNVKNNKIQSRRIIERIKQLTTSEKLISKNRRR